jgi:hypothetical protein
MPGWLVAILVVLLIVILGCGGCFVTCSILFKKGADKAQEFSKQVQQEMEKQRKAAEEEAKRRAATLPAPSEQNPKPESGTPDNKSNQISGSTRLPDNFPKDVPIYSGLTPTFAISNNLTGSGSVVFSGTGDPAAVANYYKKQLADKGWTITTDSSFGDTHILSYAKDDRTVSVTASPDDKKVTVSINYGKK